MIDKAVGFSWNPGTKKVEIAGTKSTMRVSKRDAYRLAMVCLMADPRWEMLPADWREFFTKKVK